MQHSKPGISSLGWLWWWLRQVTGDAAFENYLRARQKQLAGPQALACHAKGAACAPAMSDQQFYLDMLARKYSGVSRCC